MRETLLLFIVLTEYCSSSCLFCPVLSSYTGHALSYSGNQVGLELDSHCSDDSHC